MPLVCRYPWSIYRGNNTLAAYKEAYIHVVDVLRSTGAPFVYQQSYNSRSYNNDNKGQLVPLDSMYIGDAYTDMVCVTLYNFGTINGGQPAPFSTLVQPFYNQVSPVDPVLCVSASTTRTRMRTSPLLVQWSYTAACALVLPLNVRAHTTVLLRRCCRLDARRACCRS
jgi:hypothetical protein